MVRRSPMFKDLFQPRADGPARGGDRRTGSNIVLVMMVVLLVVAGLAHAFTELFHG